MAGQAPIELEELGDECYQVHFNGPALVGSHSDVIMFTADRDCWLNQAWFKSATSETNGETYTLYKVADGVAVADASEVALTDSIEVHSSGGWAANTLQTFTPTSNNFIAAGDTVYLGSSATFQTTTPIAVGLRLTTRRH